MRRIQLGTFHYQTFVWQQAVSASHFFYEGKFPCKGVASCGRNGIRPGKGKGLSQRFIAFESKRVLP
jgi:hypothetical protein